jgi:hypothetical protein
VNATDLRATPPKCFSHAFDLAHQAAAAGVADFGDGDYRAGLRVLLESMEYNPRFTERSRGWFIGVSALEQTLQAHDGSRDLAAEFNR